MTICLNCPKQLNNPKAKYCSDKCRMAYKRRKPEQKPEQMAYLEKKSLSELRKEGRWIPNWKRSGYKSIKAMEKTLLDIIQQFPSCTWLYKGYSIQIK